MNGSFSHECWHLWEKAVQSPVFFSLLQVDTVYKVSVIFRLNAFLVSGCTKGFAYLLCWPRGRGIGLLVCTQRFSLHEFYNFLPFGFSNLYFLEFFFSTHDIYPNPHPQPRPMTSTYYPRHLTVKKDCLLVYLLNVFGILAGRCGSLVVRERDYDTRGSGFGVWFGQGLRVSFFFS